MEHLTYDEYMEMGGAAEQAAFSMLEVKANRLVDTLTHGRLAGETPLRQTVKYCLMQLVDAMAADAAMDGGTGREVSSISNDGVSVTFEGGSSAARAGSSTALRNTRIVREWLDGEVSDRGVNLLYAGVDR